MANTFEQWIATLPASIEPEFVMSSPDEQIRLAAGQIELSRGGRSLGKLDGEVVLEWRPRVQIVCVGDSDARLPDLHDDSPIDLHVPQLGLKAAALVTDIQGERHEVRALLLGAQNTALPTTEKVRFYLVNFPSLLGDLVCHGSGPRAGASRHRLRMAAGHLVCTVDQIASAKHIAAANKGAGYLLTHVGQIERAGQPLSADETHDILEALYGFLHSCAVARLALCFLHRTRHS